MEPSTELKTLYLEICEALSNGDDSFFEHTFSQKDGVLAIGTDPTEWWAGYATITRVFKAQLEETGGLEIVADTPHAYCDGSIGWIAGQPTLKLPDGTQMGFRLTAIFQKEQDNWKIVQWHFSKGIPNEDLIGETLTTQ
ncbi:MAG: nuclear transport factor 2 family protein [Deltaproteobacteria bacterium]|nr:nuclear transport factor 2 family protein [Deltaproteobacteria bacterium]